MGKVFIAGSGSGGADSDELTANAADVLAGKTAVTHDSDGEPVAGTMPNQGAWKGATTGEGNVAIPKGYHDGTGYVSGSGAYNAGKTAGVTATKVGTAAAADVLTGKTFTSATAGVGANGSMVNNGAKTLSVGRNTSVSIPAGYHNGSGKVNGPTMTDLPAKTYNPSTSVQTIAVGQYTAGIQTIEKVTVTGLTAANIKSGVNVKVMGGTNTISNVTGTLDTTARWG